MYWKNYINKALKSLYKKWGLTNYEIKIREERDNNVIQNTIFHLENKDYSFAKYIPFSKKKNKKEERILIKAGSFSDKLVLKALSEYLNDKLFKHFQSVKNVSFAYQKGRGVRDALISLKKLYIKGNIILKIDIKKFFNNINKEIIHDIIEKYKLSSYPQTLIEISLNPKLEKNEYYDKAIDSIKNGIPQGNPCSAILSNLYLLEFDQYFKSKKFKFIRYADDMIFIVDTKIEALNLLDEIKSYLINKRYLEIHPLNNNDSKTLIFDDLKKKELRFLGMDFDGQNIFPSNECIYKLISEVYSLTDLKLNNEEKINKIKNKVNQWCSYYAFTDISDSTLNHLTKKITKILKKKNLNFLIDLKDVFLKMQKKQKKKWFQIYFKEPIFGEEFNWLSYYKP